MFDDLFHPSSLNWRYGHLAPLLDSALQKAALTRDTTPSLEELSDAILRDIGLRRSEIPFVPGALETQYEQARCGGCDRFFLAQGDARFRQCACRGEALSVPIMGERLGLARQARLSGARAVTRNAPAPRTR
jgi:hypothetical protein